jgi:hypothetical protein
LIRVYNNLESIMTELDDAETRKGILGHRSVETLAGAFARVAFFVGSGCGRRGAARGAERVSAARID